MSSSFYLCTGFHRSGTSLVASSMYDNGVDMGSQLMGPSFGNPRGHFEDIPFVDLHDRLLRVNSTDWRCTNADNLIAPQTILDDMKSYMESRGVESKENALVGAKDPRAVFFLPQWSQILGEKLKTVLVFRDWRYSVSSLLKRHSRELLQFSTPIKARTVDIGFWEEPEKAAKMWLAASEKMITWKRLQPENTLLFNQHGYIEQQDALKAVAESLDFDSQIFHCQRFQASFMQQSIPQSLVDMIPLALQLKCDEVQHEMMDLADIFTHENVVIREANKLSKRVWSTITCKTSAEKGDKEKNIVSFDGMSFDDAMAMLSLLPKSAENIIDWQPLVNWPDLRSIDYDSLYLMAVKHDALDIAEISISRALAISQYHYRYTHLGDTYMRRKMPLEAKVYYEKAAAMVPENSAPIAKLAEVEAMMGNVEQSDVLLSKAKSMDPTKPAIKQAEVRLEQAKRRAQDLSTTSAAPKDLSSLTAILADNVMRPIYDYSLVMNTMNVNEKEGRALDDLMVRTAFLMRNNYQWLVDGCEKLGEEQALCLLDYIVEHSTKYWPHSVLETELLGSSESIECDFNRSRENERGYPIRLGVVVHAFYPELLNEIFAMLDYLPHINKVVLTCTAESILDVKSKFKSSDFVEIVEVENKGRDILPWLLVADRFDDCDAVLKLHTKSTPHDPALAGWRLQLLWQLCGKENIDNILTKFVNEPDLGMVIPKYHPVIAPHINWGENFINAQGLADKMGISLPDKIEDFPAGSMFWYRPHALKRLLNYNFSSADFPDESGQIDGTLMHAIERIVCVCAVQDSYQISYVE